MTDLLDRAGSDDRPRIDPRIARRWIDARREEGRKRLHLAMAGGTLLVLVALAVGILHSPLLAVRHVRIAVRGAWPAAAVAKLAGVSHRTLTIDVHGAAIAARLDADPWLGAASVTRHWPGTVTISVAVRSPLAVVPVPVAGTGGAAGPGMGGTAGGPSRWAEIDPTGRVLAIVDSDPPGLPVLQGLPGSPAVPAPGHWLALSAGPGVAPDAAPSAMVDMSATIAAADVPAGPAAALAFLDALPPLLRGAVLSITVGGHGALSFVVSPPRMASGTVTVVLGDGSELQSKVDAFTTILDEGDLSGVGALDLSVPSRPATAPSVSSLSPATGSGTP